MIVVEKMSSGRWQGGGGGGGSGRRGKSESAEQMEGGGKRARQISREMFLFHQRRRAGGRELEREWEREGWTEEGPLSLFTNLRSNSVPSPKHPPPSLPPSLPPHLGEAQQFPCVEAGGEGERALDQGLEHGVGAREGGKVGGGQGREGRRGVV